MTTRIKLVATAIAYLGSSAWTYCSATTVNEAVAQTIKSNPDITRSVFERRARDEEVAQARAGYLPTLDATAGFGIEHSYNPSTRAVPGDAREDLTRREAGLLLRQMVFDGFATKNEVQRQRARVDSEAFRIQGSGEITGLRAVEVFFDVLRRWDLLALTKSNLVEHQKIHEQVKRRSDQGVGRRADLDQVEVRVALAETNVVAATNNLQDAASNYLRVVGQLPKKLERPSADDAKLPASLAQAISIALGHNPTLKSAFVDVNAAKAQHRAAKSPYFPRFDLELASNWNDDLDGVDGIDNDASIMLRMRYNLFRGGGDSARRRQTAHLINEAAEIRNRTCRQVVESVRLSWAARQSLSRQLGSIERQVNFSRRTREAYQKQFEIGRRTLLDVLDSENELFLSNQDLINARIDHEFAGYRILAAMGQLLQSMGAQLPGEAQPTEAIAMETVGHCGVVADAPGDEIIDHQLTVSD